MNFGATTGTLVLAIIAFTTVPGNAQSPEIIDRIAAAINHTFIITASDIRRERAVMGALSEPDKSDREILEDLIGWRLLEEQMAQFPGLDVTDEELAAALKKEVANSLAASIEDVRTAVRQRLRRTKYVDRRFGQFIRVTDEEKRQYYQDVFVPEARKAGLDPIPGLDAPGISELIQSNVIQEKRGKEIISALKALRDRSDVEIFQ